MKVFENKAALAAASLKEGQIVTTKGYYTAGDGGGATYLIKTAAAFGGTPDGYGDHTLANGNVAVLQHSGSVNVKQFGATGDGVTDDTVAIQAAVDSLSSGGGLYFPNGVYGVSNTLHIDQPISILGESAGFEQIFQDAGTLFKGAVIELITGSFTTTSNKPIVNFTYNGAGSEQRVNASMKNIVIHGNRGTTQSPVHANALANNTYGHGIRISGARYITLENVYTLRCAEDGIRVQSGGTGAVSSNNIVILNCASLGNADDGLDFAGGDSFVIGGQFGYNGGDGVACDGGLTLTNPRCWDNFTYGCRVTGDDVSGSLVTYDNQRSGLLLSGNLRRINLSVQAQDNGKDTGQTNDTRSGVLVSGVSTGCNLIINSENKHETPTTGQVRGLTISNAACDINYLIDGDVSDGMTLVSDASTKSGLQAQNLTVGDGALE